MKIAQQGLGERAMVLAAGLGTRMRSLTKTTPKPLIKVAGKPIIEYGFEHLRQANISNVVVNAHYLSDQIIAWCKTFSSPNVTISDETGTILDTGGGILKAIDHFGSMPFFVLNSDCFWTDQNESALERLRSEWDDEKMDCLLLLIDPAHTSGYDGDGDFIIGAEGRLKRQNRGALAYIGVYLVHPRLFVGAPQGKFSMNLLWDKAIVAGRLFGIAHNGHWFHVGTPEAIAIAEAKLNQV